MSDRNTQLTKEIFEASKYLKGSKCLHYRPPILGGKHATINKNEDLIY